MGKDEHPVARPHLIGGDRSKHNGLAGAGGEHQQGAETAMLPLGVNLLPGGLTSVSSDKYYDSRSVNLMFAWGRFEDECCSLTFSGSQVVVAGPNNRGFQVYHSVDPELLDRLIAEVQTYGVKN